MNRSCFPAAALALFAVVNSWSAHAAEAQAGAGRELVKRYADAIVGVELVVTVKVKMGDREMPPREQPIEVNGTVISANGLTVTTLAGVDPRAQFEAVRSAQQGRGPELVSAEFKEVKLRFADGKEVPARFVLKDADLDLAFMAPEVTDTSRTYTHVKLDQAAEGEVLNSYYFVARAPKTLQRVPLVRPTQVIGIVEKPRRLFLMSEQAIGSPIFDSQGRVLGVSLQHFANGRPTGLVLLPAADIAEMAKQAEAVQSSPAPAAPAKSGN